ncbi:hypothetical protein [Halobacillus sp. BBL2006]|uniref:hypothetical protein n=1 Tax=Halobacillus sp. BBL2006 TaxID=1543706 RepID=UPI00054270CC|nr:hypothetical protein [Halobacillus sp. BBL2006]KHE67382.1 hypothetical protein LD39_17825 [Halobacillus sp. BBL2006]
MGNLIKSILYWGLIFPVGFVIIRILIDYMFGREVTLISYIPVYLGSLIAGLVFVGPLMYLVSRLRKRKRN